jgi:hypothetical protein
MDSERDVLAQSQHFASNCSLKNEGNIIWEQACCLDTMKKLLIVLKKQSRYRPGVAQRVPGS